MFRTWESVFCRCSFVTKVQALIRCRAERTTFDQSLFFLSLLKPGFPRWYYKYIMQTIMSRKRFWVTRRLTRTKIVWPSVDQYFYHTLREVCLVLTGRSQNSAHTLYIFVSNGRIKLVEGCFHRSGEFLKPIRRITRYFVLEPFTCFCLAK